MAETGFQGEMPQCGHVDSNVMDRVTGCVQFLHIIQTDHPTCSRKCGRFQVTMEKAVEASAEHSEDHGTASMYALDILIGVMMELIGINKRQKARKYRTMKWNIFVEFSSFVWMMNPFRSRKACSFQHGCGS